MLFVSSTNSDAAEPFRIESELPTTSLIAHATYLEDPESELTLEARTEDDQVVAPPRQPRRPAKRRSEPFQRGGRNE